MGFIIASTGYIQVHAYASNAEIPLRNVSIIITDPENTALAMRITDRSGLIGPVEIPAPDRGESVTPNEDVQPYTLVNLIAEIPGYERVMAENLQVFADTTTYQDLEMIPLSTYAADENQYVQYNTPPQNL